MFKSVPVMLLALILGGMPARADESESAPEEPAAGEIEAPATETPKEAGYADADRDGANDRFRDADGDGVDDLSGKPYPHHFDFIDEDRDGRNDVFVDQDGDGVNDLGSRYVDQDGDGICDNVIDFDGDGRNDITGLKYSRESLDGFRYGRVDEERRRVHRRFVDQDGDGMNDLVRRFHLHRLEGERIDLFIDEDGDGISDGRRLMQHRGGPMKKRLQERLKHRPRPPQKDRPGPHNGPGGNQGGGQKN